MSDKIVFSSYSIQSVVEDLANYFNTVVEDDHGEKRISIPRSQGDGTISGMDFRDGLSVFMFDGTLKEELSFRHKTTGNSPLRFLLCMENEIRYYVKADLMQCELVSLLGCIASGTSGSERVIQIPAKKHVSFISIELDRKKYLEKISPFLNSVPAELKVVLEDVRSKRPFLYQGYYSLAIAQCIHNIRTTDYKGLVKRVFIESQALEIISMQLKQFVDSLTPGKKQKLLRKRDLELVVDARNRLLANLVHPPTIKELAQMTGTNENKLKAGFRLLYNTSINKLLQDERLIKAKLLMAEEAYSIKEIAKKVGYKHSAHFASKFKKRFGILPSEYIRSID